MDLLQRICKGIQKGERFPQKGTCRSGEAAYPDTFVVNDPDQDQDNLWTVLKLPRNNNNERLAVAEKRGDAEDEDDRHKDSPSTRKPGQALRYRGQPVHDLHSVSARETDEISLCGVQWPSTPPER